MAKSATETVEVPLATLQQLQARLDQLEERERLRAEAAHHPTQILDRAFEAWKKEAGRPASERTQDLADRLYGTEAPRFRCRLDSTTEAGKPGPRIAEHPALVLTANSDLEAGARYLALCGIQRHDYRLVCEPAA